MKRVYQSFTLLTMVMVACNSSFFEKLPQGSASSSQFYNEKGIELLLIGAYTIVSGSGATSDGSRDYFNVEWTAGSAASNWLLGDVRAGDGSKGSEPFDQQSGYFIERHELATNSPQISAKWNTCYDGINRCNEVLKAIKNTTTSTDAFLNAKAGEARFLRGHFYFELKKMWNNVPWIDENTDDVKQPNTENIWPKIEADFKFAASNLPPTQSLVGRATQGAAQAYLAKAYVFQAKFAEAKPVLEGIIASGRYKLNACFRDAFDMDKKNSAESIFAVQNIVNDGTPESDHGNWGEILNHPFGSVEGECCGFFTPTYDMANAFKTDANGLPLFDTYQDVDITNDYYPKPILSTEPFTPYTGTLDPRIDWTIGRRGIPYLDWGVHPGAAWTRDRTYDGPYSPKKMAYTKFQNKLGSTTAGWAAGANANNINLIRYADVLLWAAEVEIEVGSLDKAKDYINQVRNRIKTGCWVMAQVDPADPTKGFTKTPAANYKIELYTTLPDKEYARKALRFERRLEFGMEGHRFFDLVRWGIADQVLNAYLTKEIPKRTALTGARFTKNKNEYLPIPATEITNTSKGGVAVLKQNPGY